MDHKKAIDEIYEITANHIMLMPFQKNTLTDREVVMKTVEIIDRLANVEPQKLNLNFGQAIEAAKQGKRISRSGWNRKGMYLQLQVVDEHSKMQHNYIYMSDVNGKFFPWNPNNLDVLAEDWCILD